jgi:hypothetical protein
MFLICLFCFVFRAWFHVYNAGTLLLQPHLLLSIFFFEWFNLKSCLCPC